LEKCLDSNNYTDQDNPLVLGFGKFNNFGNVVHKADFTKFRELKTERALY